MKARRSLVGSKSTATTTIATAVATTPRKTIPTTPEATTTATSRTTPAAPTASHAGQVRSLRDHLDVATLEDALVQDEGLRDEVGFGELDVGVTARQNQNQQVYSGA